MGLAARAVAAVDPSAAAATLRAAFGDAPFDALLVLGSGLGALVEALDQPTSVAFAELRGFPSAGVSGHLGRWVAGGLEGRRVLVQAGRYHLYEGWPAELVCAPIRTAGALGIRRVVLTNAAGGIRPTFGPGTLVLLEDQLDLTLVTPPLPPANHAPPAKASPSNAQPASAPARAPYTPALIELALACARELRVPIERGVYAGLTGPSYETPAEIRMLETMGADVVGMSTVLEASTAASLGMECLGLSLVTNLAAGRSAAPLDHREVLEVGARAAAVLEALLRAIVRALPR